MLNSVTLVLQVAVILVASRLGGIVFRKMRQPQVMGEMAAGIMLGPSLLGWVAPHISAALFPPSSLGYLSALSQVGLVIFMFLVGLGINPRELKKQGHAVVLTSHASIVMPFVLGSLLSLYLYPRIADDSVSFTGFALFMGAAMSITAFPVLARILTERNMLGTRLGTIAIACAAVGDVTGWCVLAGIVVLVRAQRSTIPLSFILLGSIGFALVMIYGVRRLLGYFESVYVGRGHLSANMMALALVLVLASALFTEWIGLHLLFGAFLVGAIMPKNPQFVRYVHEKLESITVILLLPLFFALTGLRTSIGSIRGAEAWFYLGLIMLVAIAGKLGGSMFAGRFAGMRWRDAASLGILMNTRGLMEVVILNIGLDIQVISPMVFSMMVLMALVTTFMTTPLLEWVHPQPLSETEAEISASSRTVGDEHVFLGIQNIPPEKAPASLR